METSGWTIHPPVGPQGASHERCRAAPGGTERGALLGDPDSAGEEPSHPQNPKILPEDASSLPPGNWVRASPSRAPPQTPPSLPARPRPLLHRPLPQVSPPGGGPDVAFRFGAVLDGARTQEDVFRASGVRRLGELALRG